MRRGVAPSFRGYAQVTGKRLSTYINEGFPLLQGRKQVAGLSDHSKNQPAALYRPGPASSVALGILRTPRDTSEKEKPRVGNNWSQLMARIFALDVLECPRCGGRMRISVR